MSAPRATTYSATPNGGSATFLRRLQLHQPNSTQLVGLLTLVVSGAILLLLAGVAITAAVIALVLLGPIVLISAPLWAPLAIFCVVSSVVCLSFCGLGFTAAAAMSWVYRYLRGLHPPGSDRVDYARSRIATTAREYGGYLHSKVKDAAPGA